MALQPSKALSTHSLNLPWLRLRSGSTPRMLRPLKEKDLPTPAICKEYPQLKHLRLAPSPELKGPS